MTVITKPMIVKDDKSLVKEDVESSLPLTTVSVSVPVPPPRPPPPSTRRLRRATCLSQCCLLLTAALALAVAFIGAVHIVRQLRRPRYHRGFCAVPIPYNRILDESMISGNFREKGGDDDVHGLQPVMTPELVDERLRLMEKLRADGSVELDYELDLKFEEFEEFQMPQISHGRYLHDFKVNQTAIIDPDGDRCFVMPLDQEEVPKPRSFYEIIRNLRDGVYGLDISEVRVDTRVVFPPVEDPFEFGFFIGSACAGHHTYRLKPIDEVMIAKRSVDAAPPHRGFQFVEFTGKTLLKYNILNLEDI